MFEMNGSHGLGLIPRFRSRSLDLISRSRSLVWVTPSFVREPTWCEPPWVQGGDILERKMRGFEFSDTYRPRDGLVLGLIG